MSREIEKFLEILKDPQKHFGINVHDLSTCKAYEYEKYDCEIALLHKCHFENDPDNEKLLSTFKDVFSKDYLELRHPFHNDVVTRAVFNITRPWSPSLFLIDENNKYPWIIYNWDLIGLMFITPKNVFFSKRFLLSEGSTKQFLNHALHIAKVIQELKLKDLKFQDKKFGIDLGLLRPWHAFYDFNWFNKLNLQDCRVIDNPMFFKSKNMTNLVNGNLVSIRPSLLDICNFHTQKNYVTNYINEALEAHGGGEGEYNLTLWLGIPGERRIWLEQWEGIPQILKNLNLYFSNIKVYIDGMTSYDGERTEFKANVENFWKIVENIEITLKATHTKCSTFDPNDKNSANKALITTKNGQIDIESLSGYDYKAKIARCNLCDIAICELGTTELTPFNFLKKSGVAFYFHEEQKGHMQHLAKTIPHLKTLFPYHHKLFNTEVIITICNYHIPYQHLYNLAAECLEELSLENKIKGFSRENPLKMHRLSVPSVELINKAYELEQKTGVVLKNNKEEKKILQKIKAQEKLLRTQNLLLKIEQKQAKSNNPSPQAQIPLQKPKGAVERVHRHLAYKLGIAIIVCSKSLLGYARMPFVLYHIKAQHKFEQEKFQKALLKNPTLKLLPLESYADYENALKEQRCYTYKLGLAMMEAHRNFLREGLFGFILKAKD